MKKHTVLAAVFLPLFLILFNLLFFVLGGTKHPLSVWIAYGFIHLAYLLLAAVIILTGKNYREVSFGISAAAFAGLYFLAELIVGVICILIAPEKARVSLVIQLVLLIACAAFLIPVLAANAHSADKLKRQAAESGFIKTSAAKLRLAAERLENRELSEEVERVYAALHASPSRSGSAAVQTEGAIREGIAQLEQAVDAGDLEGVKSLCVRLQTLIRKRNSEIQNT